MAGRTHRAKPGEAACGVGGCERPAGFATATPGSGPCLRHAAATARTREATTPTGGPRNACRAVDARLRGPGRPTPDPLALVGVLTLTARRAGFTFEEAWTVATVTVLHYMSDRRAEEWWDVLSSTERAWADAYVDARSPLALLPREIPQPIGYAVAEHDGSRTRRNLPV